MKLLILSSLFFVASLASGGAGDPCACKPINVTALIHAGVPDTQFLRDLATNNYGGECKAHDLLTTSPYWEDSCDGGDFCGEQNWCTLKWCYVDKTCGTASESDVVPGGHLYYSYDACDDPNCFEDPMPAACPKGDNCQPCPDHNACALSGEFCFKANAFPLGNGDCRSCSDCTKCGDGIDNTCSSCSEDDSFACKQIIPVETLVSSTKVQMALRSCASNAECAGDGAYCETNLGWMSIGLAFDATGVCLVCPADIASCSTLGPYYNQALCQAGCAAVPLRTPCSGKIEDDNTNDACAENEFCLISVIDTDDTVSGVCTSCYGPDPANTTLSTVQQCRNIPFWEQSISGDTCIQACSPLPGIGAIELDPKTEDNYQRFSDIESQCSGQGCCSTAMGLTSICNNRASTTAPLQAGLVFANYETEGKCSTRSCDGNFCMVNVINSGGDCVETLKTAAGLSYDFAGTCTDGRCVVDNSTCPGNQMPSPVTEFRTINDCVQQTQARVYRAPFQQEQCIAQTGGGAASANCQALGPLSKNFGCRSTVLFKDGDPDAFDADWETSVTGVNSPWYFAYMLKYTTEGLGYADTPIPIKYGPNNEEGVCLIGDPNMPTSLKNEYDCIIKRVGAYLYKGSTITLRLSSLSNETASVYEMTMNPQTSTIVPVLICPESDDGGANPHCFGSIACAYNIGTSSNAASFPCGGEYRTCVGTYSPTHSPTGHPNFEDPPTAHGDPIIWTFDDECYDLNKDGLWDATANKQFNHDVKIGIYNDFMREIQVVDKDGNLLVYINVLGEFEHDEANYPYKFIYKEKECPEDIKDTECSGTYKEWIFDAQEFRYTVQLLRHDYLDQGIPEGDLGYHLDIYPRPYKSFYEKGHKETYSGLFFENPLPDELEYCAGGSPRNRRE